jgi:DNA topoisomerase-1
MKLFIVESPGKIKTLRKILGPGWRLEASVGHTTELGSNGPKRLGFEFVDSAGRESVVTHYVPRGSRGKEVLGKLRKAVKESEIVYLATDPDREGEAIAWHLVEQLKPRKFVRVSYTQITDRAVLDAIAKPKGLDRSLIEAQRARQCLDKLVGFEVSPLLWNSTGGKSAGRVQSATLHLICERERERLSFKPENYWTLKSFYREGLEADFTRMAMRETTKAPAVLPPPGSGAAFTGDAPEESRVKSAEEAQLIAGIARTCPHRVLDHEQRNELRNPPPPLITSSLQQAAGARFKYSPKQTMQIAQELYEGVGGKGLITYMRTDAVSLSPEFVSEARDWLRLNAPETLPASAPGYRVKADSQGAHEAIRPTTASLTPDEARRKNGLSNEQFNVYRLIWERAIASQCKPARLSKTKITIGCADTRWLSRGMTILEEGYLRFWKNLEDERTLPTVKVGQELAFKDVKIEARTTQPPSRYSEPKLVQLMEKKGIGRPSTYASTVATLKDRDYVILDKGLLAPTSLGMATDEALTRAVPDLVDAAFTAQMEASLDQIAEGKLGWEKYLIGWNRDYLAPALVKARTALQGVARVAGARPTRRTSGGGAGTRWKKTGRAGGENASQGEKKRVGSRREGTTGVRAKSARGSGKSGTRSGAKATSRARTPLNGESEARLGATLDQARKMGSLPICPQGHGAMEPRLSKKGGVYWKCANGACDAFAWNKEFSEQPCPDCGKPMEKVPSAKVTGGFFLKCPKKESHASDVVMFRSRNDDQWERAR